MNSSQNSAFSYKNNRPLSWPVIHANILTHSHVRCVTYFFPLLSLGFPKQFPKNKSNFANRYFRSNVRFQSPILDDRIISHPDSLCLSFFVPLLFGVCSSFVPIFLSKSKYYAEISRIFWQPTGTDGYFLQSCQTYSAGFAPAEAGQGCDQPRNSETPTG